MRFKLLKHYLQATFFFFLGGGGGNQEHIRLHISKNCLSAHNNSQPYLPTTLLRDGINVLVLGCITGSLDKGSKKGCSQLQAKVCA